MIWVLIANIIAWPTGYFVMQYWLQNFAYRTQIGLSLFFIAGLFALSIALITVSYQALRAAGTQPANSLKYE